MKIKILPVDISNKIAAGEVVERPASVVKELVENSIDAGSSRIEIEVDDAGKKLIKITDNGEGMSPEDLQLAVLRHATSKIKDASDLYNITTLGFRGEALASIAAVSRVKIVSCCKDSTAGFAIDVEGGEVKKTREVSRAKGTTIEIYNLFYNTPARLKFLKSGAAELSQIIKTVTELALAYPEISFKLVNKNKEIINVAVAADLLERVSILLGKDTADNLLPVSLDMPALKIRGLTAKAGFGYGSRGNQYIFVNKRPVKDKVIYHAITQAYHTFLAEKQFAAAVLFIEIAPEAVDVNVHPAKREIKFRNSSMIHEALVKSIRDVLVDKKIFPSFGGSKESFQTRRQPVQSSDRIYDKSFTPQPRFIDKRSYEEKFANTEWALIDKNIPAPELFEEKATALFEHEKKFKFMQFKNSYVVGSSEEGIMIIDQHAAHERILFDELLSGFQNKKIEKQKLLLPVTLNLNKADAVLMGKYKNLFGELGFEIEEFGRDSFAAHSYPVILGKLDIKIMLEAVIREIFQLEIEGADMDKQITRFLAPIACHGAVRANDELSPAQIESIINRLWKTTAPYTCPHGRPTMIKISWNELEKKFRRK
ncbi:MAG: DNA mismatch repair endonuclease MutL [Candidatus Omnitrophota bacterium]